MPNSLYTEDTVVAAVAAGIVDIDVDAVLDAANNQNLPIVIALKCHRYHRHHRFLRHLQLQ
jgi:nitrogenase molybdenum-iron protein alpha/beta subunit